MSDQSKEGLLAVCGSLLGLSAIAVGLRLYTRKKQSAPFLADDAFAVAGLVTYIGASITVFISVHYKTVGYASSEFTPAELASTLELSSKLQIAWDILSNASLAFVKLSVLYFYRRIFCSGASKEWFHFASIITVIVVVLWLVVFSFLTGFQCGTHFSALWNGTYLQYCTISFPFLYGLAVSDFLLDVWILVLPIPRIAQLNATISKKFAITGVFLLACLGVGFSIARMVTYIDVEKGGPLYFVYHDEEGKVYPTESVTRAFFFTMLETGISLVAVNLPTLWFLSKSVTPEAILQSIRSVISLASLRSNREGHTKPMATDKPGSMHTLRSSESSAKQFKFHGGSDIEAQRTEVSAMPMDDSKPVAEDGVYVKNSVVIERQLR
ncbi:hypothetical protein HYFRA_00011391 [Hymenoscyphus fraxineus]|uniref:Rhodopsin domain-containing protein n=1 Tax=Hymenoscyphus fraxineus TaxID=746836 RepID=A0A9N9PVM5_9HELO|nr:hypothetical protein HYFRA_00011391 [Hymenoscyphus fraxineus]